MNSKFKRVSTLCGRKNTMRHCLHFPITFAQHYRALKVQSSTSGRQCAWVVVNLSTLNPAECATYSFFISLWSVFEDTKVHDFVEKKVAETTTETNVSHRIRSATFIGRRLFFPFLARWPTMEARKTCWNAFKVLPVGSQPSGHRLM